VKFKNNSKALPLSTPTFGSGAFQGAGVNPSSLTSLKHDSQVTMDQSNLQKYPNV
jgi:hypothetical protein